jgi:coenzyme F420 hydrogenase subunit beta
MRIYGPGELSADVIQKGLCIGCGACIQLCPYIRSYKGKTAMLFPCTHTRGRCFAFCPKVEVDFDFLHRAYFQTAYSGEPLGYCRRIKSARAGKKADTGIFQAGGTVSALMRFALDHGCLDAAILTDREGAYAKPRIVTSGSDVLKCASSKYSTAPTLSALHDAVKKGFTRIGVVATPCQATGVAQMRANPLQDHDFKDPVALVIGLFCTWALDPRDFDRLLSQKIPVDKIRKMDIPPPPAEMMEIDTEKGKLVIPLGEIRALIPASCANCPDMTSEFSDLSVGVLEGRPDSNILIIRTERGEELVRDAVKKGYLIVEEAAAESLEHLAEAAANKKRRAFDKMQKEGRLNSISSSKRAYLRVNEKAVRRVNVTSARPA